MFEGCRNPEWKDRFSFDQNGHFQSLRLQTQLASGGAKQQHRWSPYSWHGGSIVGIAGDDFVVIAADTRLGEHGTIYQRDVQRLNHVSSGTILGNCGFHGDALQLQKIIKARCTMYKQDHRTEPSPCAIAQMLSTTLYGRRFFPYYVYNIVAGMDDDGKGALFSYDPVGCVERIQCIAEGTASSLLMPFLDNQIYGKNLGGPTGSPEFPPVTVTKARAVEVIHDAFVSAAERETETGDGVIMKIITKDGVEEKKFPLRRD